MKTRIFNFISLSLLFICLLCSYSPSAQNLEGKWGFSNTSETVEFTKEGVFRVYIQNQGYSYGVFEISDGALIFQFLDLEDIFVYPVEEFTGRKLVLLNPQDYSPLVYSYKGKHEISAADIQLVAGAILDTETEEDYYGYDYGNTEEGQEYYEYEDMGENGINEEPANNGSASSGILISSLEQISGRWQLVGDGERMMLSSSEYFEVKSETYDFYGIWGISEGKLQLAFVQGGNFSPLFNVMEFEKNRRLLLQFTDENGKPTNLEYIYEGSAPVYPRDQVDNVANQFRLANSNKTAQQFQHAAQMQQSMHNTTMSIIYNMSGGSDVIIKDQYGNKIGEY